MKFFDLTGSNHGKRGAACVHASALVLPATAINRENIALRPTRETRGAMLLDRYPRCQRVLIKELLKVAKKRSNFENKIAIADSGSLASYNAAICKMMAS
jgi:hypothetical protein